MSLLSPSELKDHYEKFPYPVYPLYSVGGFNDLESVDTSRWGALRSIRRIWLAGCGTIQPLMFARRNPQALIVASDLSAASLRQVKRRLFVWGYHNVLLRNEDLLASQSVAEFDAIDSYGVIHHTPSPAAALRILVNALTPGGVLRVMVYSEKARTQLENLRHQIMEKKFTRIEEVVQFLDEQRIERRGDLRAKEGIADALLNPLVHVFSESSFFQLFETVSDLGEIIHLETASNFVAFFRRKAEQVQSK